MQQGTGHPRSSAEGGALYSIILTTILGTIESGSNTSRDLPTANAALALVPVRTKTAWERDMSAGEHASPYGSPSRELRTCNSHQRTANIENSLNVTRAGDGQQIGYSSPQTPVPGRQSRDTYLHQAPGTPGMRRNVRRDAVSRPLAKVICATTGLGLCCEGIAIAVAPQHSVIGQALFFGGLVVPFAVFLTVLFIPFTRFLTVLRVPRLGPLREITVALLGIYPAVVYRMTNPLVLGEYDEHLHEQVLLNLLHGSGLFAPNPILAVGPYFPGLEIFTSAGIRLSGLPVMMVMSLVIILCRLLLVLIIYHLALLASSSRFGASLVVAFYAVSPQFYSFNSIFSYQTLALTLGMGGLYLLRRAQLADHATGRRLFWIALLVLIATVVTHHATSWVVLAFLIAWAAMSRKGERKILARAAVVMGVAVAVWTTALATRLAGYFVPIISTSLQSAQAFLNGTSGHHVFGASGGTPPVADWERVVLIAYTLFSTFAALACAWILLSRAFHNRDRMLGLLGALNLAFPITDAAHFDPSVGALGDRASTFLFFPLALSCSLIIQRHPRVTRRPAPRNLPFRPVVLIALIGGTAVVYLGGSLLGSNPDWQRLPGPYLVSAEARTQDPETLAAVDWAAANLPTGSTVVADRIPADLLLSEARLWPVTRPAHGFEPALLYFSDTWGPQQTTIVKRLHIGYLYVDKRLADSLPYVGFYFYNGETKRATRITEADVDKFAHVPGLKAVYHHGPVTIYATSGLGVALKRSGFTGRHPMGLGSLDAILGAAAAAILILLMPRRLEWMRSFARDIGVLETILAVIAITIFIGGILLDLRLMPGPAFTLGFAATSLVILAIERRKKGLRFLPRLPFPRRLDPLVLLGVVTGTAGLAIALHAAWITDVADVNAILRAIS